MPAIEVPPNFITMRAIGVSQNPWVGRGALIGTAHDDGKPFAQFEHTVGVTDTGCEVFTLSPGGLHHPPYGAFCPAPGHQLGFNDLKVIEVKTLIDAITGNGKPFPDFREAYEVERVVDAVRLSSDERRWVSLS